MTQTRRIGKCVGCKRTKKIVAHSMCSYCYNLNKYGREKTYELTGKWLRNHREYVRAFNKKWRKEHPDYMKNYCKEWRKNRKEQTK
jgi:hypothetical protein